MEDDGHLWLELLILFLLILCNAVCSMTEIAIVGARKTKLKQMAENGDKGARYALNIAEDPTRLFSTIQIGITAIGIITGMLSGASLAGPLADEMRKFPFLSPYASEVSMIVIMSLVTYFSLIIGELVPKWLAIHAPEQISAAVARPMLFLAALCRPLVAFSTWSTNMIIRLLGVNMKTENPVSEEEILVLLKQGARLGTFDEEEPELVDNVFRLNDLTAGDCMTPRTQLTWIDIEDRESEIWKIIRTSSHFRLPVGKGSLDSFEGLADMREILIDQHFSDGKTDIVGSIRKLLHPPVYIPDTLTLAKILDVFRDKGVHEAVVLDEYGALEGLITLHDVLEEIVGVMPGNKEDIQEEQNRCIQRTENSWLVEGLFPIEEFKNFFQIKNSLPGEDDGYYKTLGGFVVYLFGYLPHETELTQYNGITFKVVDCDHRRIDKVLVTVGKEHTEGKKEIKTED